MPVPLLRHIARGPVAGRLPGLDAHGPGQRRLGQIVLGNPVGIADGEHNGGKPLSQTGVGILDCLRLAVEPGLRFQDHAQPIHVRDDIHPPAPGPLLEVRSYSLLSEEMSQRPVLEILLLIHRAPSSNGFSNST